MRDVLNVTGMVLLSAPSGDYDRRLVLLTREKGKITAFAHGVRRPGSSLMAASRPFSFGTFQVYEGRSAYNLQSAQITNYFDELSADILYVSLKALSKEALPNPLVRRIFELRAMVINGVYTQEPEGRVSESCVYAWQYVIATPLGSLYTFTLKEDVLREFSREVQHAMDEYIHHEFKSLEILEVLSGGKTARPVS